MNEPQLERLDPLQRAAYTIKRLRAELDARERADHEPIAIVGVGCRFPGAPDPDAYARLLADGRDATREVPADRWDVDAYYDPDPDAAGKISTRRGGFLDAVDGFDPAFFAISPREAHAMDPQQRLLLEVAWEALEHAGLAPGRLRERPVGVFVGIGQNDYARLKLGHGGGDLERFHDGTGNGLSFAAGRISFVLGLRGPCLAVDTACSSSLVAVHLACQSLRNRECDSALAGGVQLCLRPESSVFLSRARALAPDGRCKAFDAAADGFARGEGCGVVVLRRLSDARAAGDRVLATIRATAVNHDGPSSAFTVPSQAAQVTLLRDALAAARLGVDDLDYLEAHGTGTRLGDPIELGALAEVFAARRSPLPIGSVKTNFGHLEAAAGVAGLIKIALAVNADRIWPQLHFHTPTPLVDWSRLPLEVVAAPRAWPALDRPRRAAVSSFGMSGTNAHVIIEQAEPLPAAAIAPSPALHLLAVSARAPEALIALARGHADRLRALDPAQLADWCETAHLGRDHGPSRLAVIGGSPAQLADALTAYAGDARRQPGTLEVAHLDIPRAPDVAMLFTGQAAAWLGMGEALCQRFPPFRAALERCAEILDPLLDRPLIAGMRERDPARSPLGETAFAQPAIAAFEYAAFELWRSLGVEPRAVVGHSLGEFVAAHVAGVLGLDDMLRLVAARGRLMQALPGGGVMVALPCAAEVVAPVIDAARGTPIAIAAINGPTSTVVSGARAAVDALLAALGPAAHPHRALAVSHAFHSPLMAPMIDDFARALSRVALQPARLPIVSSVTGAAAERAMAEPAYWTAQILRPVRFHAALAALIAAGHTTFVELGPQAHLTAIGHHGFAEPAADARRWLATAVAGDDQARTVLTTIAGLYTAGVELDWAALAPRDGGPARRMELPTYPWQRQRYWVNAPPPNPAPARAAPPVTGLRVRWQPLPVTDAAPQPRDWIVLGPSALAAPLARALPGRVRVLDEPEADREMAAPTQTRGVVILTALADLDHDAHAIAARALRTVQAVLAWPGVSRILLVTRGAQALPHDAAGQPAHAAWWGIGRSLTHEQPALGTVLVDLDPQEADPHAAPLLAAFAAADHHGETELAIRADQLYAARLADHPLVPAGAPFVMKGVHVITGGLGGIGVHLARWLARQGASEIVLCGRRALDVDRALAALIADGVPARYHALDVADADAVDALFTDLGRAGAPIRAVFHLAGALADGPIQTLTDAAIERVFAAKVRGARNLDRAAAAAEHFVCFSSLAGVTGSAGQAAYAAANAVLDALCADRRRRGAPAISIAWSAWRATGMATQLGAFNTARLASMGSEPLEPAAALTALATLLTHADAPAQLGVAAIDWPRFARAWADAASVPPRYAELIAHHAPSAPPPTAQITSPRAPIDLPALVRREIAAIAGLDAARVPMHQPLQLIGFDSLMHIELRTRLQAALDVALPLSIFLAQPSTEALLRALAERLPTTTAALPPPPAELEPPPPPRPLPRAEIAVDLGGDLGRNLGTSPDAAPFFCVHPWFGTVFPYVELARRVRRPFCALQAVGLHAPADRSIEAMATRYRYAIRQRQPHGPIYLGGWSMGGAVAFEVACQLRERGEPVAALVMIDATSPGQPLAPSLWAAARFMAKVAAPDLWPFVVDYFRLAQARGDRVSPRTVIRELAALARRDSASRRVVETFAANSAALLKFQPRTYAGPLTVLRARDAFVAGQDHGLGWRARLGDPAQLAVRELAGNHLSILRPPHVDALAAQLDELLA